MGATIVEESASFTVDMTSSSVPRAPIHGSPPLIPGASTLIGDRQGDILGFRFCDAQTNSVPSHMVLLLP